MLIARSIKIHYLPSTWILGCAFTVREHLCSLNAIFQKEKLVGFSFDSQMKIRFGK